jgi:K+ transporter
VIPFGAGVLAGLAVGVLFGPLALVWFLAGSACTVILMEVSGGG